MCVLLYLVPSGKITRYICGAQINFSLCESIVVNTDLAIRTVTVAAVFHMVRKMCIHLQTTFTLAEIQLRLTTTGTIIKHSSTFMVKPICLGNSFRIC